jgi:hypothetical protein
MAETAENKVKSRKTASSRRRASTKKTVNKNVDANEAKTKKENTEKKLPKRVTKRVIKIPKDEEFAVRSNVVGGLFFSSKYGNLEFELNSSDDIVYLTFEDLQEIKRTSKKYFERNWLIVDSNDNFTSEQVYCALRVDQYYKSQYSTPETLDYLFDLSNQDMANEINLMTDGYKETVVNRAKELIDAKEIDSISKIKLLSALLNADFGVY